MISAEEIRFFLKMIPNDEFSSMFRQYFSDTKIEAYELVHNIGMKMTIYLTAAVHSMS